MSIFGNAYEDVPPWYSLRSARGRTALIGCVMAVALIEAWPVESRERLAIDVGEQLCRASAEGEKLVLRPHFIDGVAVVRQYAAIRIIREGPRFREDCEVELRIGDLPPRYWSDGRADYVIILKSNGENRLAFRLRWGAKWHEAPIVRLATGQFHMKISPAHGL